MADHKESSKGRVQSSTLVKNPMPAKRTSMKRRGKRGK